MGGSTTETAAYSTLAAMAKFYQSAFGMHEIMRLDMPDMKEIMLNFGDTVEAAKANPNPWIVIMSRTSNDVKEVPHLVLYVADMKARRRRSRRLVARWTLSRARSETPE